MDETVPSRGEFKCDLHHLAPIMKFRKVAGWPSAYKLASPGMPGRLTDRLPHLRGSRSTDRDNGWKDVADVALQWLATNGL